MIRSIDIHTADADFDTDVTIIEHRTSGCALLRIHTGGATVNVFGSLDRLAEIRRAAAILGEAFGERQLQEASERAPSAASRALRSL
jgi:hypothetical protein